MLDDKQLYSIFSRNAPDGLTNALHLKQKESWAESHAVLRESPASLQIVISDRVSSTRA